MIKELQEKTFKMNLDTPFEKSIVMKKRDDKKQSEEVFLNNDDYGKTKLVEN